MTNIEFEIRKAVLMQELAEMRDRERVYRTAKLFASADALADRIKDKQKALEQLQKRKEE